jgi:hypothetical protein
MNKNVLLLLLLIATPAFAQQHETGHQALQLWNKDAMANAPVGVRLWLMFMLASFASGLFFVKKHVIARWVVGGFLVSFFCGRLIADALGLVTLSGYVALVHLVCWSPGLYLLLTRQPFLREQGAYLIWSGLITMVIVISFYFDLRDAWIYLSYMLGNNAAA